LLFWLSRECQQLTQIHPVYVLTPVQYFVYPTKKKKKSSPVIYWFPYPTVEQGTSGVQAGTAIQEPGIFGRIAL